MQFERGYQSETGIDWVAGPPMSRDAIVTAQRAKQREEEWVRAKLDDAERHPGHPVRLSCFLWVRAIRDTADTCSVCGGRMVGDGYTMVQHCENSTLDISDIEPDAPAIPCRRSESARCETCVHGHDIDIHTNSMVACGPQGKAHDPNHCCTGWRRVTTIELEERRAARFGREV